MASQGPTSGDQPDPSAAPTILIGAIGTIVTILIVIFCQVLFRINERNNTVSAGVNHELRVYEESEAARLQNGPVPIEKAMQAVVQEYKE